jgi:hypothetical protein
VITVPGSHALSWSHDGGHDERPRDGQVAARSRRESSAAAGNGTDGAAGEGDPAQPITMIVGFDAGGSTDVGARLMAEELEKRLDATSPWRTGQTRGARSGTPR